MTKKIKITTKNNNIKPDIRETKLAARDQLSARSEAEIPTRVAATLVAAARQTSGQATAADYQAE